MSWYPTDTQPRQPGVAIKTYRKVSALVRWIALILLAGFALAALVGIAVSAAFTAIQN